MRYPTDITAQQAEALAGYLHTIRAGERAWTKGACLDGIRDAYANISRDRQRLEVAAIRAANDPNVRTPGVIGMKGRHWELGNDIEARAEGAKGVTCARCRVTWMPTPGYEHQCLPPADATTGAAAARAELRPTWTPHKEDNDE